MSSRTLVDGNRRIDSLIRTELRVLIERTNQTRFNHQRLWAFPALGSSMITYNAFTQFRQAIGLNRMTDTELQPYIHCRWPAMFTIENAIVKEMIQLKLRQSWDSINPNWRSTTEFFETLKGNGVAGTGLSHHLCVAVYNETTKEWGIQEDYLLKLPEGCELVPFTDVRHRGELIMQLSKDDPVVPDLCFRERGTRRSGSRAQQAIDPQFLNICKWQGKIVVTFDFVWFPSAKVFYLIFPHNFP